MSWKQQLDSFREAIEWERTNDEWSEPSPSETVTLRASELVNSSVAYQLEDLLSYLESDDWLTRCFAAGTLRHAKNLPDGAFTHLVQAGINETNPSLNRVFVEAATIAFGLRRVVQVLLNAMHNGSNFEKSGALNALYWARVPDDFDATTGKVQPLQTQGSNEVGDLLSGHLEWCLSEFARNEDVDVRRSIIGHLPVDRQWYTAKHELLLERVLTLALTSSDEYIRSRAGLIAGTSRLLCALPHRVMTKQKDWLSRTWDRLMNLIH